MIRWAPPLSIHTRLALWYTTVLLIVLLVVGGVAYSLMARALAEDVDRTLLGLAEIARDAVATRHSIDVGDDAPELDPEFHDQFLQVLDARGVSTYRSPRLGARALPLSAAAREGARSGAPVFETVQIGARKVRLVTLSAGPGQPFVQMAVSLAPSAQALSRFLETLIVLVPLGLGLAALSGVVMARKVLQPVNEITRAARRINAEDLSQRLDVHGTADELDRLAETLNAMLARLEGAFAETRRFSADAAHELRTPLTALKGGLEVALRAERSTAEYRRVLAASLDEVDRLIRLAEDLLLVARSRVEAAATRAPVELDRVALEVVDVGVRLGQPRGVSVRIRIDEPALVLGDRSALQRAALNLVENAVKYTPSGGLVELTVRRDDGHGLLSVRDTGPGIPPEARARVFEPFVRLDSARARGTGGAGLGLSIAHSIVTAHGGTLTLEEAAGGGSRFTMRLPVRE